MRLGKIRKAVVAIVGVGALTFPAWGPINGSTAAPKDDPTCDPATLVIEPCLPELQIPPSEDPSPTETATPTETASPSESPSPTASPDPTTPPPEPEPGASAVNGCIRAGQRGAGCSFALLGSRLIVGGMGFDFRNLGVPTIEPPDGVPTLGPLPTLGPVPTITPPGVTPPPVPTITPPPVPTVAPQAARMKASRAGETSSSSARSTYVVVDLMLVSPTGVQTMLATCSGEYGCVGTGLARNVPAGTTVRCVLHSATGQALFGCASY